MPCTAQMFESITPMFVTKIRTLHKHAFKRFGGC